jgi:hypothetical protein
MTEADVQRIEHELNITLPASYRKVMVSFPIPAFAGNDTTELWDSADKLIELNRELRCGSSGGMEPWPDRYFSLGRDHGGDCHALDLADPEAGVRWADRGHLDAAEPAPPFADWVATTLEDMRIYLEEHGVDPRTGTPADLERAEAELANEHAKAGCTLLLILIAAGAGAALAALALIAWLNR